VRSDLIFVIQINSKLLFVLDQPIFFVRQKYWINLIPQYHFKLRSGLLIAEINRRIKYFEVKNSHKLVKGRVFNNYIVFDIGSHLNRTKSCGLFAKSNTKIASNKKYLQFWFVQNPHPLTSLKEGLITLNIQYKITNI
jgi:hypothetical protein